MNKTRSTNCHFSISEFEVMKQKVLNWTKRFNIFCFLDNHLYQGEPRSAECLLAAGVKRQLKAGAGNALELLQNFIDHNYWSDGNRQTSRHTRSWVFGHLGYDLKNEIEHLSSSHTTGLWFPDIFFFEPENIIRLNEKEMIIEATDAEKIYTEIITESPAVTITLCKEVTIQNRLSKEEYISVVQQLRRHILRGDCYEINFCLEFFAENAKIDPLAVYQKLSTVSPNPFSALYRMDDQWLICASPERFLYKKGNIILSQPIKGTAERVAGDIEKDKRSKDELLHSAKDRSENVMVVDLVRNDLARICKEGTVKVDELFGIYSFPQVHQMISTISGELEEAISFADIIWATFPMGSMTGAPKKRVMELIEQYEKTKRGIFSGALGYITPGGDFDFNVVIRSIMYNVATGYISYLAGSGITFYSDPEKEWEECLLKAAAMRKVLGEYTFKRV